MLLDLDSYLDLDLTRYQGHPLLVQLSMLYQTTHHHRNAQLVTRISTDTTRKIRLDENDQLHLQIHIFLKQRNNFWIRNQALSQMENGMN